MFVTGCLSSWVLAASSHYLSEPHGLYSIFAIIVFRFGVCRPGSHVVAVHVGHHGGGVLALLAPLLGRQKCRARSTEVWFRERKMRVPAGEDVGPVRHLCLGVDAGGGVRVVVVVVRAPLGERAGVTVVADEGAPEAV